MVCIFPDRLKMQPIERINKESINASSFWQKAGKRKEHQYDLHEPGQTVPRGYGHIGKLSPRSLTGWDLKGTWFQSAPFMRWWFEKHPTICFILKGERRMYKYSHFHIKEVIETQYSEKQTTKIKTYPEKYRIVYSKQYVRIKIMLLVSSTGWLRLNDLTY